MSYKSFPLVGEEFVLGYRHQQEWGWKIAAAFFFGEVGAGLYFVSAFYDYLAGMAVGIVLVSVFKPIALFMHLGKPARFWRAIAGLKHSWISRGLLASVLFTGFGAGHLINHEMHIVGGALATLLLVVSMLSCFLVIIYLGFVLSYSPSIALWGTGLMPVISLVYGLLGGVTMFLLLNYQAMQAATPEMIKLLKALELGLVLFAGVVMFSFLHGAAYASDAGRQSVALLLKESLAKWFIPLVLLLGIVFTTVFNLLGPTNLAVLIAVALAELIGDFSLKVLLFKAGVYHPSLSHSRI